MLFSILIPSYKDRFLKDCIESVLNQTYDDFEIIIVNDASPYDIDSVVSKYDDSRIHYYTNEIGFGAENVVGNWNKCLSYAKGDNVICIGDDDMLLPNCLELYKECICKNPDKDVYHIRAEIINENNEVVNLQEARPECESLYSMIWHKVNNKRKQFLGDFCFRTGTLRDNGGFYDLPYGCYSDDLTVYVAVKEKGIVNINDLGFRYRDNVQTISNTQNLRSTIQSVNLAIGWINEFLDKATCGLDEKLRLLAKKRLPHYKQEVCTYCIQTDIMKNPIDGFRFWKNDYQAYGLSRKMFYSFIWKSIKQKIRGRLIYNRFK